MKKLLSFLLATLLVATLAFSVTACKKDESDVVLDETVTPITIKIETEKDDDGNTTQTLTEISLSASAKDYVDKGDIEGLGKLLDRHNDKNFTVYEGNKVRFEIPSNVTHIASNSVVNLSFITELVVGDNVEEIERGAFVGLTGLESITLPFIGGKIGAYNDARLFAYIFGSIGTDGLTSVTQNYNEGTESSTSLYVPTSLKTVNVTGDVKKTTETLRYYINDDNQHVLLGVNKDGEKETAPEGKTEYSVDSISYKDSAVQPYAFYGITTIETVNLPENTKIIPEYAFYGCTGIKTLNLDSITEIGKYAYSGCTSLRELTLNTLNNDENVEVIIREGAFSNCTSLGKSTETAAGSLDISGDITIEEGAFTGCTSLNENKLIIAIVDGEGKTAKQLAEDLEGEELKDLVDKLDALKDSFDEDFFSVEVPAEDGEDENA